MIVVLAAFVFWELTQTQAHTAPHTVRRVKHLPMEDIAHEAAEAFSELNTVREAMGMPIMQENRALQKAAQAHADYLVRHHISSHREESTQEGFSGSKPVDRALRAGYRARYTGENLSTKSRNAHESITGLFSAIYHRFGFLNLAFDEVGIAIAQDANNPRNSAFVYLMGNSEIHRLCSETDFRGAGRYVYGICADTQHRIRAQTYDHARNAIKERSPKILLYPYDGQEDVPPAFYDENPDPLPDYDVSGFPVSAEFNNRYFRKVDLLSFRLYTADGLEVHPLRLLDKQSDPHHELTRRQFALLPLKRLEYGTTYRAVLIYKHKKKTKKIRWSFTTWKPVEDLKIIRKKTMTLRLKAGKAYWLYFEPSDPHDLIGTMQYPSDVRVHFIDSNTMRVVLDPTRSKGFEIVGSGRRIRIEIERGDADSD
jgi:uncharacterized protein YkwD